MLGAGQNCSGHCRAHSSCGAAPSGAGEGRTGPRVRCGKVSPVPAGNWCSSFAFTMGAQLLYLGAALRWELRWAHVNVLSDATQEY